MKIVQYVAGGGGGVRIEKWREGDAEGAMAVADDRRRRRVF